MDRQYMRDGIDHINVYSKGKTELGRLLSNFAATPFIGNGRKFASVEGWWYWFVTGKKYHHLAELVGYKAKLEGRKYKRVYEITPTVLTLVYTAKLEANPKIRKMLVESTLPFKHYYVFDNIIRPAEKFRWTAELWNELRNNG